MLITGHRILFWYLFSTILLRFINAKNKKIWFWNSNQTKIIWCHLIPLNRWFGYCLFPLFNFFLHLLSFRLIKSFEPTIYSLNRSECMKLLIFLFTIAETSFACILFFMDFEKNQYRFNHGQIINRSICHSSPRNVKCIHNMNTCIDYS